MGPELELEVIGSTIEVPGVTTLSLREVHHSAVPFIAGQYLTVYFADSNTHEGKAYSLSSAPGETLAITVRAIGEFSNRLSALGPGDRVNTSAPYGFFTPEEDDRDLVLIAGGIGIAPFRSIIRDTIRRSLTRRVALFHSVRTMSDLIFHNELAATYFVTRERVNELGSAIPRRTRAEDVVAGIQRPDDTDVMICGSIGFVRDLWRGLRVLGVSEDRILTEAFFKQ